MSTIGIIGLGNMGSGMAAALVRAGFRVVTTARSMRAPSHVDHLEFSVFDSVAGMLAATSVVLLSLPTPEAVLEVVEGADGIASFARPGQLFIDTTTSAPETTRRVAARLAERGSVLVDAPVSGAPALAHAGKLTVMAGGSSEDLHRVMPVLRAIAARIFHVGPLGSGHMAKLANNLMAASHLAVAGEVVALAEAAGLEPASFLEVVNASTGRSFVTEQVYPQWVLNKRFDLGFAIKLMRKDVRLAARSVSRLPLSLPMVSASIELWLEGSSEIHDEEDVTQIVELTHRRLANHRS